MTTSHIHTISDINLNNAQNDTVTTGRPAVWIINGERTEYTREELETEMNRRATITENVLMIPGEMRTGDRTMTHEHGIITLTGTPSRMRGAVNKSVLEGTNAAGEAVYAVRSAFLHIPVTR